MDLLFPCIPQILSGGANSRSTFFSEMDHDISQVSRLRVTRLHINRTAGGHRDHRRFDRLVTACRAAGSRSRSPQPMQEQSHQIGLALHNYHETHSVLPPGGTTCNPCAAYSSAINGHNFTADILPFMDQGPIYNKLNWQIPGYAYYFSSLDPAHEAAVATILPAYVCPSSTTPTFWQYNPPTCFFRQAVAHYAGIGGSINYPYNGTSISRSGSFFKNSKIGLKDMTDGSSNIMVVGEYSGLARGQQKDSAMNQVNPNVWYGFYDNDSSTYNSYKTITYAPNLYWKNDGGGSGGSLINTAVHNQSLKSQHVGGLHALMGDGAVRFINENINIQTY